MPTITRSSSSSSRRRREARFCLIASAHRAASSSGGASSKVISCWVLFFVARLIRPTDARRKPVVGDIRPLLYAASSVYSRLSRRTLGVLGTCNECRCRILEFCDSGTEAASSMDEAGGEE